MGFYAAELIGQVGNQTQPFVQFRGLNDNNGTIGGTAAFEYQPTLTYQVPVHNIVDDLSWIKGRHTLSFGGNLNFLRNPQSTNINSYNQAVTNASYFIPSGLSNTGAVGFFDPNCSQTATPVTGGCFNGSTPSPTEPHYPKVAPSFGNNYDYPLIALIGMVSNVTGNYNFTKAGTTLPEGEAVTRHFAANAYEMYVQDSWKVKPNLTLTYGLRYSLFSPPWETNGEQVTPNVNLGDWFSLRAANQLQGIGSLMRLLFSALI